MNAKAREQKFTFDHFQRGASKKGDSLTSKELRIIGKVISLSIDMVVLECDFFSSHNERSKFRNLNLKCIEIFFKIFSILELNRSKIFL